MDSSEWKRPDSIPYPTVWLRFSGKTPMSDGKIPKFRIQCITEDMFEEIINLMCNIFARDEHTCSVTKLADDPVSLGEMREIGWKILKQKVGLVAIMEEEGEKERKRPRIAGVNITAVETKSDKMTVDMFKGGASRTIMEFVLNYALKDVNVFELFEVEKYMSSYGRLVLREFRGQSISVHLLKARFPLCKALGITATMTYFSPTAAQVAAEKAGMRVHKQIEYEDYKVDGKVVFPNLTSKYFKVMVAEIK